MPQRRSFKSMLIEVVSFLTLFALIGTMSSNFWERYLIQSELSNIKSSLHILKEAVYKIGTAYDNLHQELNGLAEIKEIKSAKSSLPEDVPRSKYRNSNDLISMTNLMLNEIRKVKDNKNVGVTATKSYDTPKKSTRSSLKNATTATRNALKSTGMNVDKEARYLTSNNYENPCKTRNIHKCCNKDACCDDENTFKKF